MIASLLSAPYTFIIDSLLLCSCAQSHKKRSKRGGDIYPAAALLLGRADQSDKNMIHHEQRMLDDYYSGYYSS
jgi:hypothetical protein